MLNYNMSTNTSQTLTVSGHTNTVIKNNTTHHSWTCFRTILLQRILLQSSYISVKDTVGHDYDATQSLK